MSKKIILSLLFLVLSHIMVFAQNTEPEMADALRKDGKIYVVILVLATIFAGIIAFVVHLDRKISKIEKNK